MTIKEVNPEQGIVDYGRNKRQFDLLAYYDTVTVASLWMNEDGEWKVTKRLDGNGQVKFLESETDDDVITDFLGYVQDWLYGQSDMYKELGDAVDNIG